jgi:membrane glycosyltransferase
MVTEDYALIVLTLALLLFFSVLTMVFAAKLATVADVHGTGGSAQGVRRDHARILLSVMAEIRLRGHAGACHGRRPHPLHGRALAFGKTIGWGAQARGVARGCRCCSVARKLWPQTLFVQLALAGIALGAADRSGLAGHSGRPWAAPGDR